MTNITDTKHRSDLQLPVLANEAFDPFEHYNKNVGPTHEFGALKETEPNIKNIGWTLGNDCPYRCTHCYSMNARIKGRDMSVPMIERIVDQLAANSVETVNLGGNEPLFTNGPKASDTLLPYIIQCLTSAGIEVGITTSGVSIVRLYRDFPDAFSLLNDVDVSLDSPFEEEHNKNRGARIYQEALQALSICQQRGVPHSIITAAMNWNFSIAHIDALHEIAVQYGANIRINPIKPIQPEHMKVALPPSMYYAGFSRLMERCNPLDLGEPPIASVSKYAGAKRCPCGRTSFRIHSITPDGKVYVSPCVYLHDFKSSHDLLRVDLVDIINSPQFRAFRQRHANPNRIDGCADCELVSSCGGGCVARSYLYHMHRTGEKSLISRDPYCPREHQDGYSFPSDPKIETEQKLVHMDYLCTWIGCPKELSS